MNAPPAGLQCFDCRFPVRLCEETHCGTVIRAARARHGGFGRPSSDLGCIRHRASAQNRASTVLSTAASQCTSSSQARRATRHVYGILWVRTLGAVRPSSRPHRHPRRGLRSSLLTEEPMTPPHALLVPAAGTGCSAPTFDRGGPSWDIELVVCRTDDGAAMKPGSRSSRMLTSRDLSCCGSADARAASAIKRTALR